MWKKRKGPRMEITQIRGAQRGIKNMWKKERRTKQMCKNKEIYEQLWLGRGHQGYKEEWEGKTRIHIQEGETMDADMKEGRS